MPVLAGLVVAALGLLVVVGWLFEVQTLRHVRPFTGWLTPSSGLSFLFLGAALIALHRPRAPSWATWLGRALCVLAIGVSFATLHAFFVGSASDYTAQLLDEDPTRPWLASDPAPNSAVGFVLLGLALLLVDVRSRSRWRPSDGLAVIALLNALLAGFAYSFDAPYIFGVARGSAMSLPSVALFVVAAFGVLLARPDLGLCRLLRSRTAGGVLARRLLPAVVFVPVLLGILHLLLQDQLFYNPAFATSVEIVASTAILLFVTWGSADKLDGMDRERRRGEAARGELAALVEASEDAIVGLDVHGDIQTWNQGAAKLYAHPAADVIGHSWSMLKDSSRYGDARATLLEMLARVNAGDTVREELPQRRADGAPIDVSIALSPVRDSDGDITGIAAVGRDITERKRVERAREELLEDAQLALARRDEFVTVAAHELKTPLTALRLQLDVLERALATAGVDAGVRARAATCQRSAARLTELVLRLLDISRIHEGRLVLERTEADLTDVVLPAVDRFRRELEIEGRALVVELLAKPRGRWDEKRLREVAAGLVSNAVRYGTGTVRVEVSAADGVARLAVEDEGGGIPRQHRERVFQRFERAAPSTEYGGLGIGLWLTREIIRAHGGDVSVHEVQGRGARFLVELPLNATS